MPTLRLRCPNSNCRVVLSIPENMQGQRARCAACGHAFMVPPMVIPNRKIRPTNANPSPRSKAA